VVNADHSVAVNTSAGPVGFFESRTARGGVPLAERNTVTRAAITSLAGTIDTGTATRAWEAALHAPAWDGPLAWIHGDLLAGNLLTRQGRLSAVIDFGCLGVGDPACDVMAAWTFLSAENREVFRAAVKVDDATWARGRGWALSFGLIALPYYQVSNPAIPHSPATRSTKLLPITNAPPERIRLRHRP
jgi:aminoglycoside phosphotransferase (APT) family kinase protein